MEIPAISPGSKGTRVPVQLAISIPLDATVSCSELSAWRSLSLSWPLGARSSLLGLPTQSTADGVTQQTFTASQLWGCKSKIQVSGGWVPCGICQRRICCGPLSSAVDGRLHVHVAFSPCACLSSSHTGFRAHPSDLILPYSPL